MNCKVCGSEITDPLRKSFCSVECYHQHRYIYKKNHAKQAHANRKKKSYRCIMCGEMTALNRWQICDQCKKTETYQSYGYGDGLYGVHS